MKKQMNRKDLIEAIMFIKPGLTRDNINELAEFISFNDTEIVSFNNEISISYPYDSGIVGAVKGEELLKILQNIPDDTEIKADKNKLIISKKGKNKIKAELNMLDAKLDAWPEIPEDFEPLPENIVKGLKFCLFSVSPDPAMGALNCVYIDKNTVTSCDNFRGTQYKLSGKVQTILIPLNLAKTLINYNIKQFAENDSWLFFEDVNSVIICCRKVGHEYPFEQIQSLFKHDGTTITLPEGFNSVLARSEILSQINIENQKIVKLQLLKNKIIISSSGDVGTYQEETTIDYAGDNLTILVNPVHLKQILEKCSDFILTESNINFKTDTFNHVIALIAE